MPARFHPDFLYSTFIGASVPMPELFAADYWAQFLALPGFSTNRTAAEVEALNMELKAWRVARLYCMSAFRPEIEDAVDLLLPIDGVPCEKGMDFLPQESWLDVAQITGNISNSSLSAIEPVSVTVTAYGQSRDVEGYYFLLNITRIATQVATNNEIIQFLQKLLGIFGMDTFVQFDDAVTPPQFNILERGTSDLILDGINTISGYSNSGNAKRQISFKMTCKTRLRESISKLLVDSPGAKICWLKSRIQIMEGDWEKARNWLEKHHNGPWQHSHYRVPYRDWNPDVFLEDGKKHEVIPVGVFDFTKSKKTGVGAPLKGHRIFVDLFRDGDNWHFAFHHAEDFLLRKRREALCESLNSHIGTELISISS